MKNKGIVLFLIVLAVVIVIVMVSDFNSTRPDNLPENPYALNVDEYKNVDPDLIAYRETKNFKLNFNVPMGIAIQDQKMFVVGDSILIIINNEGSVITETKLDNEPRCITLSSDKIFIGFENYVSSYSLDGEIIKRWEDFNENSVITSLDVWEKEILIADAGMRRVYKYSVDGEKRGEFEGKHEEEALHGFIIPSPYFDLAFNSEGDLWIVNPGNHSLENYTLDGDMRAFWRQSSITIDGFSGCCNPAHFTFLPDGSFVTSEKGLVRIKVYKPSGEFSEVVAAPDKFIDEGHAPDVIADNKGNIYALDYDKNMIRVFEHK